MNKVVGVLATIAGLAVAEVVAGFLGGRAGPVLAVGEWVIELTPGSVAERAIGVVGRADKPLLVVGVLVVLLAAGAGIGALWPRSPALAGAGFAVLAAVGVVALLTRPGSRPVQALAPVAAGATAVLVLRLLHRASAAATSLPGSAVDAAGLDRRTFLRDAGLVLVGSAVVGGFGRWAGRARGLVESARSGLSLPVRRAVVPAGADLGVDGVAPWLTPAKVFYRIDTALSPPLVEPDDWSLRIHGMVDHEITLTYEELLGRGLVDAWVTLCCVSNPVGGELVGNTRWSGVPIKDLLDEAGVRHGADALLSRSHDGWTCGTPLSVLTDGRDALLAVAMDGEPLPVDHGFPVRQVVPGLYGYVSATKWVVDWEVTRFADFSAYWTERGWSPRGPVKTQCRIDVPYGDHPAGPLTVAGVAWAQHRGIEAVEVRVDEGPWQRARLAAVPNPDTWVQWEWEWDATRGDHVIDARATDAAGEPQTKERADVVPDGATGYPRAQVHIG
ncbi:MAG: molybdopterin-dependent oxidoreductase [Nocardioidaceae bacterium]